MSSERRITNLHSRTALNAFLRRDPSLHLYAIGDLDTFFWDRTTWYAMKDRTGVLEVVLVYRGRGLPTVLAFQSGRDDAMIELLRGITSSLPRAFNLHTSPGIEDALASNWALTPRGRFQRMGLTNRSAVESIDTSRVQALIGADRDELIALYDVAHPENFFDDRMLYTGHYQGIWMADRLVAAAGVHTWSPKYGVAALGNIATHPEHRGQGLATRVTAAVMKGLGDTTHIGLNVRADNTRAIALYERLGFAIASPYDEWIAGPK